jgi:hypothetical protein
LKAFKDRGGKLMLHHGERDRPGPSIAFYQRLLQRFGQKGVDEFVRFYLVPDMGHVPEFGTRLWPAAEDAEHSMILALERSGRAPCWSQGDHRDEISHRRGLDERRREAEAIVSVSFAGNLDRYGQ